MVSTICEVPLRARHQRHQLRLQIGGEGGERRGGHFDRPEVAAVAGDANALIGRRHCRAGLRQHIKRGLQQFWARVLQQHVAAGHGDRHGVGAGLDPVGQHRVARAVKFFDALDFNGDGAGAGDACAHLVEAVGDVADFRFARGVLDHGGAVRQRRRHQRGVRAADGDFGKHDLRAVQSARRRRHHIAAVDVDDGAKPRQRHQVQIDRPRADGAAARQRHLRFADPRQQRPDHPKACAHPRHQIVGRGGVDNVRGRDVQRLSVVGGFAGALAADHDVDAVIIENALQQHHVGEPWHIVEGERLLGEEARDHQRQRRVLRPGNRNGAVKPPAADNAYAIHHHPRGNLPPNPSSLTRCLDCGESRDPFRCARPTRRDRCLQSRRGRAPAPYGALSFPATPRRAAPCAALVVPLYRAKSSLKFKAAAKCAARKSRAPARRARRRQARRQARPAP